MVNVRQTVAGEGLSVGTDATNTDAWRYMMCESNCVSKESIIMNTNTEIVPPKPTPW